MPSQKMALHLRWMSPFLRQLEAKSLAAWQQWSNRKSTKRQIPNNKLDLTILQHYLCKKSAVVALKSVWRIPEDSRVWSASANTTSVRIAKLGKGQAATQASAKAKRQAHTGSERKSKKAKQPHKRAQKQSGKHTRAKKEIHHQGAPPSRRRSLVCSEWPGL